MDMHNKQYNNHNKVSIIDQLSASASTGKVNVGVQERIFSLVGGAVMVYWGLRNFRRGGINLIMPGGLLCYRGITGYSPVNSALNRDTSKYEIQPVEVNMTMRISRPRSEVYNFWRKLENLPCL
ncbi:MAG: DUF2892 domain-containing protein [Bacteroidia bacterium]|nr:DUF2892 domain-containing protein [Bacteroidia bacterium]